MLFETVSKLFFPFKLFPVEFMFLKKTKGIVTNVSVCSVTPHAFVIIHSHI